MEYKRRSFCNFVAEAVKLQPKETFAEVSKGCDYLLVSIP